LDPVRSQARIFMGIVIAVAVATLGLFEAIGHRGQGVDAPGSTGQATTAPAPEVPAPGDR
jgi:hypothetical protein